MNANPLFSVLIANYNNGKYLIEAIESVYAQTYTNWEIIIVDDASIDNSKELYKELEKDGRIHIFFNEENKGCGYTKRRCAELANGEICGFLDADDMLLPNALMYMVDVHSRNSDVSIVYSRCYFCNEKQEVIGANKLLELQKGESFFDYRGYGAMNFASYKKSFYDKTEGISAKIKAGVDQDLYFKLEEVGRIFVLNEFTYKYFRRGDGQITSSKNIAQLYYWNLEVRRHACIRRNLNVHEIMIEDFSLFLKDYAFNTYNEKANSKVQSVLKSPSYRIGYIILQPIRFLKNIFNHL